SERCGQTAASPTIALGSAPGPAFFGLVLSHAPAGPAAAGLWDAFVTMASAGGVYGIKRDRMGGLQFPG
ncbi:MAG: disulfide bond formation protein DsbA, partial [Acidimicrobiales bacterium]